jgi:hypothetical protein
VKRERHYDLVIEENDVQRRWSELEKECQDRPEFAARQAAIDQKRRDAKAMCEERDRLDREAHRLYKEAYEEESQLRRDIPTVIEEENGRAVQRHTDALILCHDESNHKLEELRSRGQDKEYRRELLQHARRCIYCEGQIDQRDAFPDNPLMRHIVCWWCRKHLGKTHCYECYQPIARGESGECAACVEKAERTCCDCGKWMETEVEISRGSCDACCDASEEAPAGLHT